MKSCIKHPLRELRILIQVFTLLVILFGCVCWILAEPKEKWIGVYFVCFVAPLIGVLGLLTTPHIELSKEGIIYQFFFRKRQVLWEALVQVGVMFGSYDRIGIFNAPIIIILPGGKPRQNKEKYLFLLRNLGRYLMIPRTQECLDFICSNYGELDYDDFAGLSDWEKKYYESIYKVRKEKEE